jgi:heat shock protein HtpX
MSKTIAKWTTGAQVITTPRNEAEAWLVETVRKLAADAGVAMPEVAMYEGEPNAFATGAFQEFRAGRRVDGPAAVDEQGGSRGGARHELSHVANGDMVTLTLIQGVVNTFVVFLSRIVGSIVDRTVFRTERGTGPWLFHHRHRMQIVFGILASLIVAWFSRWRSTAQTPAAPLLGPQPMVNAAPVGWPHTGQLPQALQALGIAGGGGAMALFASHPPIEARIAALQGASTGRSA